MSTPTGCKHCGSTEHASSYCQVSTDEFRENMSKSIEQRPAERQGTTVVSHPLSPVGDEHEADLRAWNEQKEAERRGLPLVYADGQEEVDSGDDSELSMPHALDESKGKKSSKESSDEQASPSQEDQLKHPNVSSYDTLVPIQIHENRPTSKGVEEKPTHPNSSSYDMLFPIQIHENRPSSKGLEEKPTHPNSSSLDELFPSLRIGDKKEESKQENPHQATADADRAGTSNSKDHYDGCLSGEHADDFGDLREKATEEAKKE